MRPIDTSAEHHVADRRPVVSEGIADAKQSFEARAMAQLRAGELIGQRPDRVSFHLQRKALLALRATPRTFREGSGLPPAATGAMQKYSEFGTVALGRAVGTGRDVLAADRDDVVEVVAVNVAEAETGPRPGENPREHSPVATAGGTEYSPRRRTPGPE